MPQNIAWFNQVDRNDIKLVGGLGANLGEMTKAGLPIQKGFIVTSHAYYEFLKKHNINVKIKNLINTINFNDPHSIKQVSEIIKKDIIQSELPHDLNLEIYNAYKKIGLESTVSISSSSTSEIHSSLSLATNLKTYSDIKGETNVLIHVKKCWSSLFDEKAILFRHENKIEHNYFGISVIVQDMLNPDKSGKIYTANQETGNKENIIINAVYGLFEPFHEQIHPDHYEISKTNNKILSKVIANQNKMIKKSGSTFKTSNVSLFSKKNQKISDMQILELANLGKKLEKQYYFPQEIDWIISKNKIFITLTKQITLFNDTQAATPTINGDLTNSEAEIVTATKVYINLSEPDLAKKASEKISDGVGLLRAEFMMAGIGVHPKKMLKDGKRKEYIKVLADDLEKFCSSFSPRPIIYRTSDFKTNEYRSLEGGREFEPIEPNPMLGFRGSYRYINDPEIFKLELEVVKYVRNKKNLKNLWLMLPFVRTPKELEEVKKIITASGLHRSPTFKLWMMVEIPSNVILLDKFIEIGIDGISIGTNDLTMLILGTDRDNSEVIHEFDENNEAVLWAIEKTITTAGKYGITSSICGQAASYPSVLSTAIKAGVTSVSVAPYLAYPTKVIISKLEEDIYSKNKSI